MKPQEMKLDFIRMRAEGQSYSKIAEALHISKATCTAWERDLKAEIVHLQQEQLNELYTAYGMQKEARIRRIGDTLQRIEDAIAEADLAAVPPERLLDIKLKYAQALKDEFTGLTPPPVLADGGTPAEILAAYADIYARVRRGDITADQAGQEAKALAALLTAYDATQMKEQIDAIGAIMDGRSAY